MRRLPSSPSRLLLGLIAAALSSASVGCLPASTVEEPVWRPVHLPPSAEPIDVCEAIRRAQLAAGFDNCLVEDIEERSDGWILIVETNSGRPVMMVRISRYGAIESTDRPH